MSITVSIAAVIVSYMLGVFTMSILAAGARLDRVVDAHERRYRAIAAEERDPQKAAV